MSKRLIEIQKRLIEQESDIKIKALKEFVRFVYKLSFRKRLKVAVRLLFKTIDQGEL
jgi:hypothetical protein